MKYLYLCMYIYTHTHTQTQKCMYAYTCIHIHELLVIKLQSMHFFYATCRSTFEGAFLGYFFDPTYTYIMRVIYKNTFSTK